MTKTLKGNKSAHSKISKQSRRLSQVLRKSTTKSAVVPNDDFIEGVIVIPPDGGWGWLIVVMAFFCNFVVDGTMYTFGIFLDEISESFNVHPTKIALANSIMSGFYFVVGPVTCALANRYGFRTVAILGAIISSTAFFLSTLFDNITVFLILIGCFCGLGFNMMFIPSILVVGFYFERWRALATCLSVCGSSIGIVAFPPIITTLLHNLSWQWKFRVLSGFTIATFICSLTYKPLKPTKITDDKRNYYSNDSDSISSFHVEKKRSTAVSVKRIFQRFHNTVYPTISDMRQDSNTVLNLSRISENSSTLLAMYASNASSATFDKSEYVSTAGEYEQRISCCNKRCLGNTFCCCKLCSLKSAPPALPNRPMYRDDILYMGSLGLLSGYSKSKITLDDGPSSRKSTVVNYHLSVTRVTTAKDIEESGQCVCCPEAVVRTMATMLDIRLLKSPSFLILTISGFVTAMGLYSPFIFLIQRAENMNIEKNWCALLLTFVGIANTVGRILCGVISSFPKMDALIISCVTMFITGSVTILSNYFRNLEGQVAYAVLFGMNLASFPALRSIVLVDLLGLDNLTNAFGITTLFYGIASFIGVPISGALQNYTGTYETSFLFAGCAFLFSAVLMIPIKTISKWEAKRKKPKVTFKT